MKPTRRAFLLTGTSLAAASITGWTQSTTPSTSDERVVIHRNGSMTFSDLLKQHYAGLYADPKFSAVAPFCALLTVKGKVGVRALAVNWSLESDEGRYDYPLDLESPAGQYSAYTGQRLLVSPGTFLLVSPFFAWNPRGVPATPIDWASVTAKTASRRFISLKLLKSTQIDIALKGAIFADGTTEGTHLKELTTRVLRTQAGVHDAALWAHKALLNKRPDSEVTAGLKQYIADPHLRSLRPKEQRLYQEAWRSQAKTLLKVQQSHPEHFQNIVASVAHQRRLTVTSTT